MSTAFKPQDYSTVSPYLIVDGASAAIGFLETVFGAVALRRFANEAGKLLLRSQPRRYRTDDCR